MGRQRKLKSSNSKLVKQTIAPTLVDMLEPEKISAVSTTLPISNSKPEKLVKSIPTQKVASIVSKLDGLSISSSNDNVALDFEPEDELLNKLDILPSPIPIDTSLAFSSNEKTPLVAWQIEFDTDGSILGKKHFVNLNLNPYENTAIRFKIPVGSVVSMEPVLRTNYPVDGQNYSRDLFFSKSFVRLPNNDLICEFIIQRPGPYQYYLEYKQYSNRSNMDYKLVNGYFVTENSQIENSDISSNKNSSSLKLNRSYPDLITGSYKTTTLKTKTYHFQVNPALKVNQSYLNLDAIVLKSINPRLMGSLNNWETHIKNSSILGYNMIHFIPIQERGSSNSPYSIYDQLRISKSIFQGMNPEPKTDEERERIFSNLLIKMEKTYNIIGVIDVVWNHTANNTKWLESHPEAGFNLINSPHLRAAAEIDQKLAQIAKNISKYGFNDNKVANEQDVDRLVSIIKDEIIIKNKLWEYYTVDIPTVLDQVKNLILKKDIIANPNNYEISKSLQKEFSWMISETDILDKASTLIKNTRTNVDNVDNVYNRFDRQPDPIFCYNIVIAVLGNLPQLDEANQVLKKVLDLLNLKYYKEYDDDVNAILTNIKNTIMFERFTKTNWKFEKPISPTFPLVDPYFTTVPRTKKNSSFKNDELILANNGWIWGGDPLKNFAESQSKSYLRREVIVWGDCVKLNYGKRPADNPWLWKYMRAYTTKMAKLFHGFRIDNCHSTPFELAEYLLDEARLIRPNLYVTAELFTGDEAKDEIFVSRLGINSLIRESINSYNIDDLSRHVHRNGGIHVGSLDIDLLRTDDTFTDKSVELLNTPCSVAPLRYTLPHSIFFDNTHDNETPAQARTAEDALSNAAAVSIACCSIGSSQGYDELYPELINLVHEQRKYKLLDNPLNVGIGEAKRQLNNLHREIANYREIFVSVQGQYLIVHRIDPITRDGVLLITRPAFKGVQGESNFDPIRIDGSKVNHMFAYRLEIVNSGLTEHENGFINGFDSKLIELDAPILKEATDDKGFYTTLNIPNNFTPGSIMVVKTLLPSFCANLDYEIKKNASDPMSNLNLGELNIVLYRCGAEEYDTIGLNTYDIPKVGSLPYCGYQGWMSYLSKIIVNNDLGHPLFDNLRAGNWALDYIVHRLEKYSIQYPKLLDLITWLQSRFDIIKKLPKNLVPKYFSMIICTSYNEAIKRALSLMNPGFVKSSDLISSLALTSIQLVSDVSSTSLWPLSKKQVLSMSAGLPHFSTSYMRCWGRDIFIALDGLLLTTHRWEEAREHILAFGSVLRNGLIPNLLDSGRNPRYNARDATWFWVQAVQDYCNLAPEGLTFLNEIVPRRFPENEDYVAWDSESAYSRTSKVSELVYEILYKHANVIKFREHNAGSQLDEHMKDHGFNINIYVDWNSGLILGGNSWNCGTWMDKMGSSDKAGNRGVPSTPRDGADIEIIGLLKSCLRWVVEVNEETPDLFPYQFIPVCHSNISPFFASSNSFESHEGSYMIPLSFWNDLLKSKFEEYFWVPIESNFDEYYKVDSHFVNQRGIFKDTYGSTTGWTDYQLRPNLCVAMVVAPELFEVEKARQCLQKVRQFLQGPIGMRTLDPTDFQYRPYYDNSNNTDDPKVANGANYHQGPEWVWCTGYFLRALLNFFTETDDMATSTLHDVLTTINNIRRHIKTDVYCGLPELTNLDGEHCANSCPTQAWSSATMLTVTREILQYVTEHDMVFH
ncbi:hypothetical protein BB561_001053 [Smittium simulii]|uniref:Glycogen debranching enzyme n=1 Tax=Smittium simulii TaxID=133385 RepID=A0A2T9YWF5_9FUNG|nr:hypothetical protein BB561_001053 [Smittium simulii]